jgi:hypothetical protein
LENIAPCQGGRTSFSQLYDASHESFSDLLDHSISGTPLLRPQKAHRIDKFHENVLGGPHRARSVQR